MSTTRKLLLRLAATLLTAFPVVAFAGPWCLGLDGKENCRFQTAEECYETSNIEGGFCLPNPREFGIAGDKPYCVLTSGQRRCIYRSKTVCLTAAMRVNGGCVRNTERDLARRAAGQSRIAGCAAGSVDCDRDISLLEGEQAGDAGAVTQYSLEESGGDSF